ncbi:hypothetical protein FPCIR_1050 [Fusarium pseudocircinatum]|uniref:Uncharacterized protein n=1 Tax=Fusarium pseudocircinatum TaxID=56676 RepID=A0A8H5PWM5_9HYPO|nr:hypothetical protein FPCIR_1050 [Fusarium pseudocircinatum]
MSAAEKKESELHDEAMASIAGVSTLLRQAIEAAMPVAPEQYMTIAVPGTVIDLEDYENGGEFVYDLSKHAFPPTSVRQAEGRLVDSMMPIANIMIGNTGKSVARSYSCALDALLPAKATISSGEGARSPGESHYDAAMKFLRQKDANGKTAVDLYREKQQAWCQAQAAWDKAKIQAQANAEDAEKRYPPTPGDDFLAKQKQYIADWTQMNYMMFRTETQGAWMDWVVNGQKYNVDFNFGVVDVDSIMSQIEDSKESLRNSTLPDETGASDVYGVSLTPARWATYCKRKAEGWYDRNGTYTLGQLDSEIARLNVLAASYTAAQELIKNHQYPVDTSTTPPAIPAPTVPKVSDADDTVTSSLSALYTAEGSSGGVQPPPAPTDQTATDTSSTGLTPAQKRLADARAALFKSQQDREESAADWDSYDMATMTGDAAKQVATWITAKQSVITSQLAALTTLRATKAASCPPTVSIITGATAPDASDPTSVGSTTVAPEGSEYANPVFGINQDGTLNADKPITSSSKTQSQTNATDSDPWTTISFSFSAADRNKVAKSKDNGFSTGGSVGFALWGAGGSYSHDSAHSSMQDDMASCDVSVSFSALVVDIDRPWLQAEIFDDADLDIAADVLLSPGASRLKTAIATQETKLNPEFPAYPTSFILAADTSIDFTGSTRHIQEYFNSKTTSSDTSVGWGPFSTHVSSHHSSSHSHVQCHTTATGCKLSFGAPQIIAWVSEILPELPRAKNLNPLWQGAHPTASG